VGDKVIILLNRFEIINSMGSEDFPYSDDLDEFLDPDDFPEYCVLEKHVRISSSVSPRGYFVYLATVVNESGDNCLFFGRTVGEYDRENNCFVLRYYTNEIGGYGGQFGEVEVSEGLLPILRDLDEQLYGELEDLANSVEFPVVNDTIDIFTEAFEYFMSNSL